MTEIDLDEIVLSEEAAHAWLGIAERVVRALQIAGFTLDPASIADERARVNADGTLAIYVSVPGIIDVSMVVPAGQWALDRSPEQPAQH